MATPESIAIRRADALDRAAAAIATIGEQTGAEVAPYPAPHKRPEMNAAIEAEWLAAALETIAGATAPIELETFDLDLAIESAYAAYDSDERVHGPDDFDAFKDALTQAFTPPEGEDDDADNQPADLAKMTRAELDAYAAERDMADTSVHKTKADLIAALDALVRKEENDVDDPKQPTPEPQPEPTDDGE